ncbi:MAG: hypothetical protein HZA61_08140 [Candidatus Eisenbacteria bacterium]|uniref:Glycoside hydrolase family 42 N-terminal domain-containing protein n=1 Tax=Eiseniibacteriota bacterium TaxID=2212470 RepID=A0A933SBH4_UNCEI|nr:hypothetical protein [Candidatus Eisenbacteria bacterium]
MKRFALLLSAAVAALALLVARAPWRDATAAPAPRELWLYQGANLADTGALARIEPVWRRAAAAGYTHVVLVDPKFARLAAQDGAYFARVRTLRSLAGRLGLEIVPGVSLVGRAQGAMLAMDPNLAEAVPVRGALFEVRGGVARLVADPPVALAAKPDEADVLVRLNGTSAVIPGNGVSRIGWNVPVSPWRCYHVRVKLAGEGFRGEPRIRVVADGRELAHAVVPPPSAEGGAGGDESRHVVFNSQDARRVRVTFSVAGGARGTLTWSDWAIEECGPVNLVRRPGLPFTFEGLAEGRDFPFVRDSLLGMRPWRGQFDFWHEPPAIRLNRPDGTRLRASWHHAAVLLRAQVAACLADTAVLRRQRDEIARVRELFGARTLFLMHDEIRAMGLDATCTGGGRDVATILAANLQACLEAAGDARVLVWNDMVDPLHNAGAGYYLVRGDLASVQARLPAKLGIANWNHGKLEPSLRAFAGRGHRQVYAGYYDGSPEDLRAVLPVLDRTKGVTAVMYTTWQDRYDDLEAFARIARGR